MPEIEVLEQERIRIRDRQFHVFYRNPPQSDGSIYDLEASANDRDTYARNHLKPHELRGVLGRDLLPALSIMIENPKSHLKNMSIVHFDNLNEGPIVKAWIYFDHADWHFPLSLVDFCDLLKAEIIDRNGVISRVEVFENDGSINFLCAAPVRPLDDCYATFQALDDLLLKSYRACLRLLMKDTAPAIIKGTTVASDDGHGIKWWVRYVVVPLAVGLIALIALLLR